MDELIILLIRGIVRLLSGDASKKPPQRPQQWEPGPTAPQLPPEVAARLRQVQQVAQPQQGKRRQTKRRPPPIPIAAPIMLSSAPSPVESIVTAAKPIPRHATSIGVFTNQTLKLTPADFRRQIVMNEILLPPVALRDDR